jgi:hypothetical protein
MEGQESREAEQGLALVRQLVGDVSSKAWHRSWVCIEERTNQWMTLQPLLDRDAPGAQDPGASCTPGRTRDEAAVR